MGFKLNIPKFRNRQSQRTTEDDSDDDTASTSSSSSSTSTSTSALSETSPDLVGGGADTGHSESFGLSDCQRKITVKKTVSFSEYDELYEIERIPETLFEDYFTSFEQLQANKEWCRTLAKAVSDGTYPTGNACIRGVEKYTQLGTYKRKFLRRQLYDIVKEMEQMERIYNQDLSTKMATLCNSISQLAIHEAHKYGIEDAFVAKSYCH